MNRVMSDSRGEATVERPSTRYVHRPAGMVVRRHLSQYPRHYSALALFVLAMVLVPTVGGGSSDEPVAPIGSAADVPAATGSDQTTQAPPAPAGNAAGTSTLPARSELAAPSRALGAPSSTVQGSLSDVGDAPAPTGGTPSPPPTPAPAPPDPDDGSSAGGVDLPPPPPVPVPAVPEELEPVVAAVGPLTTQGCSSIGLAGVVVAVAAPSAGGDVPVAELMPYLAPAYSACATFPAPSENPTICELDEAAREAGYPSDVSGLMKTPNIIGTGIDTLYGIESAVEAYTGQTLGVVDQLAEQLGCH